MVYRVYLIFDKVICESLQYSDNYRSPLFCYDYYLRYFINFFKIFRAPFQLLNRTSGVHKDSSAAIARAIYFALLSEIRMPGVTVLRFSFEISSKFCFFYTHNDLKQIKREKIQITFVGSQIFFDVFGVAHLRIIRIISLARVAPIT